MKANSSTQTFSPEDSKRFAEENNKMIDIIKEMIENHEVLFDVSFALLSVQCICKSYRNSLLLILKS